MCERQWLHETGCARVGGRERAHLGARRRSRRSGRPSEPTGEGRAHPRNGQGRALSSARPLGTAARARHFPDCCTYDDSRVSCARARTCEQPNARENNSLSCDDHGDMRRGLGCARIEKWFTWLFESSWRSTCPAAAALAAAELFAAADAQVGRSSRLESRPRPRFSRKETGFECWQPRTAAIVQHHQYSQSEQRHRHLRSGRGSIYLVEGALDAQRRRQHEQVLVQRLPPCSFETTLPPHPGRTGKWSAGFLQRFQSCTTELQRRSADRLRRH